VKKGRNRLIPLSLDPMKHQFKQKRNWLLLISVVPTTYHKEKYEKNWFILSLGSIRINYRMTWLMLLSEQ
jgi:hypothetical protein